MLQHSLSCPDGQEVPVATWGYHPYAPLAGNNHTLADGEVSPEAHNIFCMRLEVLLLQNAMSLGFVTDSLRP